MKRIEKEEDISLSRYPYLFQTKNTAVPTISSIFKYAKNVAIIGGFPQKITGTSLVDSFYFNKLNNGCTIKELGEIYGLSKYAKSRLKYEYSNQLILRKELN